MRNEDHFLVDMVVYARFLRQHLTSVTRQRFESDSFEQVGVTHLLLIIGEAASKVSAKRREHYDLPWNQIVAMRNRLAHEYFGVVADLVWEAATKDIDALLSILEPHFGRTADAAPPFSFPDKSP